MTLITYLAGHTLPFAGVMTIHCLGGHTYTLVCMDARILGIAMMKSLPWGFKEVVNCIQDLECVFKTHTTWGGKPTLRPESLDFFSQSIKNQE